MRLPGRGLTILAAALVASTVSMRDAHAQTAPAGPFSVQIDGGLTVGNTTSGATGLEIGWWAPSSLKIYAASTWMFDVTTSDAEDRAKIIADAIGGTSEITQRVFGFDFGVRFAPDMGGAWQPFVLGGFGSARLETDPTFIVNGQDVTGDLANLGVRLGLDLDSQEYKPYLVVGGGVSRAISSRYFIEGSYRYGRIFPDDSITNDAGVNTNRVQASFGARF